MCRPHDVVSTVSLAEGHHHQNPEYYNKISGRIKATKHLRTKTVVPRNIPSVRKAIHSRSDYACLIRKIGHPSDYTSKVKLAM